jgi:hypothetical protein
MALNERMIDAKWTGKDMEGHGRGLVLCTIPALAWRDWGKSRNTLIRIAGLRAEIWSRDLRYFVPRTLVAWYLFVKLLASINILNGPKWWKWLGVKPGLNRAIEALSSVYPQELSKLVFYEAGNRLAEKSLLLAVTWILLTRLGGREE